MLGPSVVGIEPVAPSQLLDPVRVAAQWRGPRCAALAAAGSGKAAPGRAPGRSIIKTARGVESVIATPEECKLKYC